MTACGARRRTGLWIHSAPSALTWVSFAARSSPSVSKNASTVASSRPSAAHTSRPVSWSVTTVM